MLDSISIVSLGLYMWAILRDNGPRQMKLPNANGTNNLAMTVYAKKKNLKHRIMP